MSYHILHQFDEQWFGDSGEDTSSRSNQFFRTDGDHNSQPRNSRTRSSQRSWLIVTASLIIAACALYVAMDATRQTRELQRRLSEVETKLKK